MLEHRAEAEAAEAHLAVFELALIRRLRIEGFAIAAGGVGRTAGAEAGFLIEHPVRLHDLGGELGRCRIGGGGGEDCLECLACGGCACDAIGVCVDERRRVGRGGCTGARRRERDA